MIAKVAAAKPVVAAVCHDDRFDIVPMYGSKVLVTIEARMATTMLNRNPRAS